MSDLKKSLILLVDDNIENLRVLGNLLNEKYKTAVALNGPEALTFIKRKKPDLILLDITMPDMNGFEVCRILKDDPDNKEIPIIFVTARTGSDNILKGFETGAVDYICKPFNKAELLMRIHTHITLKKTNEKYKVALDSLELSQMKLEAVFQNIPEGIIAVDKDMRVIQQNKPLKDICPFSQDVEIGKTLGKSLKECRGECSKILRNTLESQKSVKEYYISCQNKDGAEKNIILNSSPLTDKNKKFEGAILVIRDVSRLKALEDKLRERHFFMDIIGKSDKMQHLYSMIRQLADVDTNVLITGESGTGKELVAEAIHNHGTRSSNPLVCVNCSALSENILESELFGHVRGAFTGAIKDRKGRIQTADGGTLFLDEIGDLAPYIQLKLLRFLERKEYERVGDSKTFKADVRIIAATHVDLEERVRQGSFREDFYYRLKVMNLHLPPLKDRTEDIPLLVRHFCRIFSKQFNKNVRGVSDEVYSLFMNYHWPGNIRELKHVIEHAFILCSEETIDIKYLPSDFGSGLNHQKAYLDEKSSQQYRSEKIKILDVLKETDWNKAKTARLLGIHRTTLYRKMLELNISK